MLMKWISKLHWQIRKKRVVSPSPYLMFERGPHTQLPESGLMRSEEQ